MSPSEIKYSRKFLMGKYLNERFFQKFWSVRCFVCFLFSNIILFSFFETRFKVTPENQVDFAIKIQTSRPTKFFTTSWEGKRFFSFI